MRNEGKKLNVLAYQAGGGLGGHGDPGGVFSESGYLTDLSEFI